MKERNVIRGTEFIPISQENLGKFLYRTLITRNADDIIFMDAKTGNSLTIGKLLENSCRLAHSFSSFGVTYEKLIVVTSDNHINNFTIILGALCAGIPVACVNPKFTEYELQHALNLIKPDMLFCSTPYLAKFINLKSHNQFLRKIVTIDSNESTQYSDCFEKFINQYSDQYTGTKFTSREVDITNHIAIILFSSGTTGLPKGVMLTHSNVIATLTALILSTDSANMKVMLSVLPFFHTYGLHRTLNGLYYGGKMITMEKFEPELYLECVEKYKIPTLVTVPPLIQFLLKSEIVSKYDLSCVKEILCGGAPLSRDLEEAIKKKFNIKQVKQGFGMTELGLAMTSPPDVDKPGSIGRVVAGISCVSKDIETSENLGPHKRGELCVKGPTVMKGYYGNEEATREAFTKDGWMRTGDICYYDEDEIFYIVDRIKEMIKYKGFQVAPAELEQILVTHPKIQDAGVIGIPDENAGELPLAFVVKQTGVSLTEKEVKSYLEQFVSRSKYLYGGVIFIDEIPRNPSGKILRKELKKLVANQKSKL